MFDCAKDVLSYHDDEVTLPRAEQKTMRGRRDANRTRLKDGLKNAGRPAPLNFDTQGSYAMRTMVQLPDKDWDIDDGVYFDATDLTGEGGAELTSLEARQRVRDAVDDGSFKKTPEVRTNCVRVFYGDGHRVDLPVYRVRIEKSASGRETTIVELASVEWKCSDAREVTDWFSEENEKQSPDTDNGRQLRRITRLLKKYARSRASWGDSILCGFGITKLVTECFGGSAIHEDESLVSTMRAIRDRLDRDLVIKHPVTPNETITDGSADPRARFFLDQIREALAWLQILDDPSCTRAQALAAWDQVYATDYFSKRDETNARATDAAAIAAPTILTSRRQLAPPAVRREGGGRYA